MELKQLLLNFISSNEIKQRFKNGQIKVNNEIPIDLKVDLNINSNSYWDLGDFIFDNLPNKSLEIFNIRDFFGEKPTNIKSLKFLTGFTLISISKKEEFVFINKLTKKK